MTSAIQLFNFGEHPVRTITLNGKLWWVVRDVCDVLGILNSTDAIKNLDDDERARFNLGRQGEANIINESGLYALIFKSNKPEAKDFARWVRKVVLPQVMRYGLPENSKRPKEQFSTDFMNASKMVHEVAGIRDNQLALALDKIVEKLTGYSPLTLSGTVLEAPTKCQLLTPTELGKHFGVSARKLNSILCANGYQKREGKGYEPLEAGEPYAVMLDTGKQHSDGTPVRQLKWESSFITEIEDLFTQEVLS